MIIENTLELSIPVERAWLLLLDIPFVAPCLPGTQLTRAIDETTFEGTVALKVGPVSLSFRGSAVIEEVDPGTRSVRVAARGREDRGRGSAHATVRFQLQEIAAGTRVCVATNLNLAGSIIQYARGAGIIKRTAQQLVEQFATRLHACLESGEVPDDEAIKMGSLLWKGLKVSVGGKYKKASGKA